jgi:plasmid stabilization system protein ParE
LQGYPETAEKFVDQLYDFGYKLNRFPLGYPICRHEKFKKRGLRCAVFHKNYIFVYKVTKNKVIVYNVVHGKTLK